MELSVSLMFTELARRLEQLEQFYPDITRVASLPPEKLNEILKKAKVFRIEWNDCPNFGALVQYLQGETIPFTDGYYPQAYVEEISHLVYCDSGYDEKGKRWMCWYVVHQLDCLSWKFKAIHNALGAEPLTSPVPPTMLGDRIRELGQRIVNLEARVEELSHKDEGCDLQVHISDQTYWGLGDLRLLFKYLAGERIPYVGPDDPSHIPSFVSGSSYVKETQNSAYWLFPQRLEMLENAVSQA